MTSSSTVSKYPPGLYEEGRSTLQNRSMNHNCYLSKIGKMKEGLGLDVWGKLKESSLGVFIKLAELSYTWSAAKVHYILTHQLAVNNSHEVWSLIDGRPIRFSLNEFAEITGLNCHPIDSLENIDVDHHAFWREMEIETTLDGPKYTEVEKVMDFSKTWSEEKRMMVGRLMLLSVAVHGIHHGSRIPLSSAKRVFDPDGFEKHPWGRVAFSCLVNSVKIVDLDKDSYTVQGCVHALLIWLYESVPDIGELYGLRRSSSTGIPLLDWQSTRKGIKIDEFIKNEMAKHGQVRVKHMVHVSEENMYPEWSDDVEKDPAVDNLITDLVHNSLLEDVWKVVKTVPMGKNKRKAKVNENGESRRSNKKLKMKDGFSIDEEGEKDVTKKESKGKEHMEDVEDERKSLLDIWRMIEKMNESISDLDKNLISRMDALEGKFEAFVEKRMGVLDEKLSDRIRMVEVDLKGMKETKPTNVPVDSTSNNNEEDEAHSHQPSWMVEMKETSKDEFPVPQVVKKVYSVSNKKKKSETEVSADLPLCEQTYATQDHQKNLVGDVLKKLGRKNVRPAAVKVEKEKGKRPAADGSELEDITDKVVALDTKMASSSEDTWDDPQQQLVSKRLDVTLTRLGEHLKNLDGDTSLAKRVPQLAKSQKYLFVGNSTVKRIISSNVSYDHLKPAEDAKLQKLMDFLKLDEEAPLQTGNADVRFYWQIMTPRLDWPSFDYGWLKDFHMGAAMKMFRNRFIREPSQYPNQRIAFLDQDMLSSLLRDFDQFALSRRNFLFRDMYLEHYNGLAPVDSQTKKKWYVDVDHLYACLFVNKNHWVALDINLPARTIYVYDSIPSLVKDSDLVKECIALRRMIPALLSQAIPPQVRKKSYAMLEVKRMTQGVSLNKYPGDCGVFALKNIECLALGKKFDGICDENIPAIPIKLACELFDEVGESLGHRMTTILSQPNQFVIPHLIDESLTSLMSDE